MVPMLSCVQISMLWKTTFNIVEEKKKENTLNYSTMRIEPNTGMYQRGCDIITVKPIPFFIFV